MHTPYTQILLEKVLIKNGYLVLSVLVLEHPKFKYLCLRVHPMFKHPYLRVQGVAIQKILLQTYSSSMANSLCSLRWCSICLTHWKPITNAITTIISNNTTAMEAYSVVVSTELPLSVSQHVPTYAKHQMM